MPQNTGICYEITVHLNLTAYASWILEDFPTVDPTPTGNAKPAKLFVKDDKNTRSL